ncbi:hypothetical protein [Tenacibaculum amylolyticum]|uniref:hypothetical protein n=1 Tax=Tenacibaculum amylolyticum TaxID=104269 RepID=UPI003894FEA5
MKKIVLCLVSLIFCYTLFSQQKIDSSYVSYFENTREIPFLHLNKTTFLQGEEIWFKTYIQEQNSQKLHTSTSNLYVSIFDQSGILKDQQLIHIKNGLGLGNILLDSTYKDKNYYIKASTRWMKNFEEDNAYYQKINIISSTTNITNILSEKDFFEFKLLPEGGHFIANTTNNIGILIKNSNNKGLQIKKGVIKDQNNKIIRQFTTNEFGMNSVRLFIKENQTYTFYATLSNGSEIKTTTTSPSPQGIALHIVNKKNEPLVINAITNKKTSSVFAGKSYRIMIHNTRNFRNYSFTMNRNKQNYIFIIGKEDLPPGLNIITLFNENNAPISERLTFIHSDNLFENVRIKVRKSITDSLKVTFSNPSRETINVSASFLPYNTKAYNPSNTISTSFLLRPYIKGSIQNPAKYFGPYYKKQQRDLDLLLLTQGWSKYNWNTIFNTPPAINYPFENGINITATLNKPIKQKQFIVIHSKENNLIQIIPPNKNPWVIRNSFIKKNSIIDFSLNNEDFAKKISPALSFSTGKINETFNSFNLFKNETLEVANFSLLKGDFETLDEVIVQANKRKKIDNNITYGTASNLQKGNVQDLKVGDNETIIDFLLTKSYKLTYNYLGDLSISKRRGINRTNKGSYGNSNAKIFLDRNDVTGMAWILDRIYLNTVKEIFYGNNPQRSREEIHIFSLTPSEYITKSDEYTHVKLPIGFATEKKYYNPKYPSLQDDTYLKYGGLFWRPNITLDPYARLTFKIPKHTQQKINVYIEGISTTGKLISKKTVIKTE